MKTSHVGILPHIVRYCPHISPQAKLLFAEISAHFNNEKRVLIEPGALASNLGFSIDSLNKYLCQLHNQGFITVWTDDYLPDICEGKIEVFINLQAVGLYVDKD